MRKFRARLSLTGSRPAVGDEAAAVLADDLDEFHEQQKARRILAVREIGAVEFGTHGVHHHPRTEIVDPEIVVAAVAQRPDASFGALLRFGRRDRPGLRGLLLADRDRQRGGRQAGQLVASLLPELILKHFELVGGVAQLANDREQDEPVDLARDRIEPQSLRKASVTAGEPAQESRMRHVAPICSSRAAATDPSVRVIRRFTETVPTCDAVLRRRIKILLTLSETGRRKNVTR